MHCANYALIPYGGFSQIRSQFVIMGCEISCRHCMVYHIPGMLKKFGNLRHFSGQVTYNWLKYGHYGNASNLSIWRGGRERYLQEKLHDAIVEIIRSDYRLEQMRQGVRGHPSCVRSKRSYQKRNDEYWNGGGHTQSPSHADHDNIMRYMLNHLFQQSPLIK